MSQGFDIIFAGGGTTACVIVGRLASTYPSLKILVLESGQHTRDIPRHFQPCKYIESLAPGSTTISHYTAKPSAHLNGRSLVVGCGRAVGGGSTINLMFYVRGAVSDYDGWAALGNKGWSFDELLPFIKKLETFNPIPERSTTHGYSGPIQISKGGVSFDIGSQFLNVGKLYDPERPQVDDNNDFKTPNAYSPSYLYIDPVTGRRSDAASGYLYPHADNPNLTIMVGKRVKRVIIENGRAVGVEYISDEHTGETEPVTVKASKLVVVSAGTFGSPMILERSGIGARSVLERNSIHVQVDLPGVGENYQDHFTAPVVFYTSDETETMSDIWNDPQAMDTAIKEWGRSGRGKVAHTGISAFLKLRPTEAQLVSSRPALRQRWETFFKPNPDKPMSIHIPFAGFPVRLPVSFERKVLAMSYYILYPESSGSLHVTSRDDLGSPPDFDTGFLTKEGDVAQLILSYKFSRELTRRMAAYQGEVSVFHPKFPDGSTAACKERDVPVPTDAPDIIYSDADDEAIVEYLRGSVSTTFHSLGTCAMKPRDQGGVVDARLNVHGVEGLKVADLSICPTNVGNNTYSTALLIGEKAAAIIAEDLGYSNMLGAVEQIVTASTG